MKKGLRIGFTSYCGFLTTSYLLGQPIQIGKVCNIYSIYSVCLSWKINREDILLPLPSSTYNNNYLLKLFLSKAGFQISIFERVSAKKHVMTSKIIDSHALLVGKSAVNES